MPLTISPAWRRVTLESALVALLVSLVAFAVSRFGLRALGAIVQGNMLRAAEPLASSEPAPKLMLEAAWPALLVGVGWFLIRALRTKPKPDAWSRLAYEREDTQVIEREGWSVPSRTPSVRPLTLDSPVPSVLPRRASFGVKTIVGMPVVGLPPIPIPVTVSGPQSSRELDQARGRSRAPRGDDARHGAGQSMPPDHASGLVTRVIYQVGSVSWSADPGVVIGSTRDQLRELCDALTSQVGSGCRVVRVASGASSRYAKSQVAAQLAWSLAEGGRLRVLLMEADMDAPALHRMIKLNVPRGMGLSEQLQRLASSAQTDSVTIMRISEKFHALIEARAGLPGMFDSPEFSAVLAQQRGDHDLIVLDGPVVEAWPDIQRLKDSVDGVVFVVASGARLADENALALSHFEETTILKTVRTGEWPDD